MAHASHARGRPTMCMPPRQPTKRSCHLHGPPSHPNQPRAPVLFRGILHVKDVGSPTGPRSNPGARMMCMQKRARNTEMKGKRSCKQTDV